PRDWSSDVCSSDLAGGGRLRWAGARRGGHGGPVNVRSGPLLPLFIPLLLSEGCSRQPQQPPLFQRLSPDRTGVTFANTITTNDSVNVQTDPYVYNGAGVAVGDIDNDGLPDLFFSGNMDS